jgi:hypothetical protein
VIGNLENEEAKVRYGAVKNITTVGFKARRTKKQQQTRKLHS